MLSQILNVNDKVFIDESIKEYQLHTQPPYPQTFNNNDEIRIAINQQEIYTFPSRSLLYIEGKANAQSAAKPTEAVNLKLVNNAMAFLFEEIRYEINGIMVDKTKNVGITTTIKNLLSVRDPEKNVLLNAGWNASGGPMTIENGKFSYCIPLRMLLGFAEDFNKVILNVKQELVLLRSPSDINAVIADEKATLNFEITKLQWRVPYVTVANVQDISLNRMQNENKPLPIPFRTWQIHEYPALKTTTTHVWNVKTTSQMEKPRYVALAFQTDRKNNITKDMAQFDLCNLHNVRLYLNGQWFPYDNLLGNIRMLYEMFSEFQCMYYGMDRSESAISPDIFAKKTPIVLIDCSRQNEGLKVGAVDIKLEFETKTNIPENTTAYCLIIYDTVMEYTALTGSVRRIL